jgi:hypothetical protein
MSLDPRTRGAAARGRYERRLANAEADRARKAAGKKSLVGRLRGYLWPHGRDSRTGQSTQG